MYRYDNNKDQHFTDSIVLKKNSIADGGSISFEHDLIHETKSNDTDLSIVKHYNIRRRFRLLGLFILWTLLWTIFSKSGLYEQYYHQRKNIRTHAMHDISVYSVHVQCVG